MALIVTIAFLASGSAASGYSIWSVAGTGVQCSTPPACGDGAAANAAQLNYPEGVAVGASGYVYVADWGANEVRKISPTGKITIVAGDGTACIGPANCGDGGAATSAELSFPDGVAVDASGNVYIADTGDNEIRKVSPGGVITRIAGDGSDCSTPPSCGDGAPATSAELTSPQGVAVDRAGNVYIADSGDNEIRKVSKGTISRVAGTGSPCATAPSCGDGGSATSAQLSFPAGVAVDSTGRLYVADDGDNEIRRVSTSGAISRIAGNGSACTSPPSCGDGGAATSATLGSPDGVAVDSRGNIYVADDLDNEIRRISTSGTITRVAGTGAACSAPPSCGDGGSATSGTLDYPDALAVDPAGDVFIADTYDNEIRFVAPGASAAVAGTKVAVIAFGAALTGSSVTVRYALSGSASLKLAVRGPGQSGAVVSSGSGKTGLGELVWKRTKKPAKGSYKLMITATVSGHSASSTTRATL